MLGLMQDWPLLLHRLIDHAAIQHGDREVVSRSIEGRSTAQTMRGSASAPCGSPNASPPSASRSVDRIATLAWNSWRHVEAWYGIAGIGAIFHTVNPRLFPEQIAWIVNHAEDRIMMVDLTFVPLLEKLADQLPTIEKYIILTDAAHMPETSLRNAVAYEDWLAEADEDFRLARRRRARCGRWPLLHVRAPRDRPRACSIRIARTSCIRLADLRAAETLCPSRAGQCSSSSCRCSTPMPGRPLSLCR